MSIRAKGGALTLCVTGVFAGDRLGSEVKTPKGAGIFGSYFNANKFRGSLVEGHFLGSLLLRLTVAYLDLHRLAHARSLGQGRHSSKAAKGRNETKSVRSESGTSLSAA